MEKEQIERLIKTGEEDLKIIAHNPSHLIHKFNKLSPRCKRNVIDCLNLDLELMKKFNEDGTLKEKVIQFPSR